MMRTLSLLALAVMALAGCRDETVAGYGGLGAEWRLIEIDRTPYAAMATLRFDDKGGIAGEAPCNSYSGRQTAPYPWFSVKDVATTRRACAGLEQERAYLEALSRMTLSEIAGDTLILSNDAGQEMVFKAERSS